MGAFIIEPPQLQSAVFYRFTTSAKLSGGLCEIWPLKGESLVTVFNINCSNFRSSSFPLIYKYHFQPRDGVNHLLSYGYNQAISTILPLGSDSRSYQSTISVGIFDMSGAVTQRHLNATVRRRTIFNYSCYIVFLFTSGYQSVSPSNELPVPRYMLNNKGHGFEAAFGYLLVLN